MKYTVRHTEWLKKTGLVLADLPEDLQALIKKFNLALWQWNKANETEQQNYFPALLQSDAVIAARIHSIKKEPETIDQNKLNAIKAKMLLLKQKNRKK